MNENRQSTKTFPFVGELFNGRFELIDVIGRNSDSVTFKAYDKRSLVYRTLRVFGTVQELARDLDEFRKEAQLYIGFKHDNLPKFIDYHETDFIYYEFENIDGLSLEQRTEKLTDKAEKLETAYQLASSIFYLHHNNIEHNDLSSESVLFTKENKLYLKDYGITKKSRIGDNADDKSAMEFRPPEARNTVEAPFARDLWAYGVLLYMIYYGNYPFTIDVDKSINYNLPSHIISSNKEIDKIIKKCLQYFPEDRYSTFQELMNDLDKQITEDRETQQAQEPEVIQQTQAPTFSQVHKYDMILLYLNILALLVLLPFYLRIQAQGGGITREIEIDAPPFQMLVNADHVGYPPLRENLKKGDILTFLGQDGLPIYEMTYNDEKSIRIDVRGNRIFHNNKLRGIILTGDEDIPRSITYIGIRGHVSPERLQNLPNKDLHIAISPGAPPDIIRHLPPQTQAINFQGARQPVNLRELSRYQNLRSLDLTNTPTQDQNDLP